MTVAAKKGLGTGLDVLFGELSKEEEQKAYARQQELARQQALAQQAEEQKKLAQQQELEAKKKAEEDALAQKQAAQQAKIAEKDAKKKEKEEKKANSNFKYYMTFIFLFGLILMVLFLPNIREFVSGYFREKEVQGEPVLTTGVLSCTMNTNDDRFDYYYEADFNFRDSQMYRLTFTTTIKGDRNLDALELSEMKSSCQLLENQVQNLDGIRVSCSLRDGVYENEQILDYQTLQSELVTTAYLEAGGTYPNYEYQQSIDEIERQMNASNYTCERHS